MHLIGQLADAGLGLLIVIGGMVALVRVGYYVLTGRPWSEGGKPR